jgi:hypothetical protein
MKKNRKKIITLLLLLAPLSMNAQELITTAGGEGGGVIWSVGEIVTATLTDNSNRLTQGFLQPEHLSASTAIAHLSPDNQIKAYPNPVIDKLYISSKIACTWRVYDSIGKTLNAGQGSGQAEEFIDFSSYRSGYYIVVITSANETHSIKVIK